MNLLSNYHDTKRRDKNTQRENEANPSKDQQASTSRVCNDHCYEDNNSKPEYIK